jgi:hypothetical protein
MEADTGYMPNFIDHFVSDLKQGHAKKKLESKLAKLLELGNSHIENGVPKATERFVSLHDRATQLINEFCSKYKYDAKTIYLDNPNLQKLDDWLIADTPIKERATEALNKIVQPLVKLGIVATIALPILAIILTICAAWLSRLFHHFAG